MKNLKADDVRHLFSVPRRGYATCQDYVVVYMIDDDIPDDIKPIDTIDAENLLKREIFFIVESDTLKVIRAYIAWMGDAEESAIAAFETVKRMKLVGGYEVCHYMAA